MQNQNGRKVLQRKSDNMANGHQNKRTSLIPENFSPHSWQFNSAITGEFLFSFENLPLMVG